MLGNVWVNGGPMETKSKICDTSVTTELDVTRSKRQLGKCLSHREQFLQFMKQDPDGSKLLCEITIALQNNRGLVNSTTHKYTRENVNKRKIYGIRRRNDCRIFRRRENIRKKKQLPL